jgi:general secretion pathway protein D
MIRHIEALLLAAGVVLPAATISIEPDSRTVQAGQSLTFDVAVDSISDLYAFQFDVGFNPALVSAIGVTEGTLFSSNGVAFSPGFIDNTAGTIAFIGDALSGPGPGINGPGTLATIQFKALTPGTGAVKTTNVVLLDSVLGDIPLTTQEGSIAVEESSVPEPSSAVIFAGAGTLVGVLGLLRRSKQKHPLCAANRHRYSTY